MKLRVSLKPIVSLPRTHPWPDPLLTRLLCRLPRRERRLRREAEAGQCSSSQPEGGRLHRAGCQVHQGKLWLGLPVCDQPRQWSATALCML